MRVNMNKTKVTISGINSGSWYRCLPILIVRGRLYSSCVRSSMLHGSETWPIRKENEVALQRAEMRMVRWMCGVKLQDRVPSNGLRETRIRDNPGEPVLEETFTNSNLSWSPVIPYLHPPSIMIRGILPVQFT